MRGMSLSFALNAGIIISSTIAAAAGSSNDLKVEAISIQLLYATTGTLSKNIAPPAEFHGWNTIIGEGDADEPANDLLVTVRLVSQNDEANSSIPLKIVAKAKNGKILAQRTIKSLFFKGGRTVQALLVQDATCSGHLTVEANFGRDNKTTSVDLDCGE